jgi:hypothetical protein
MGAGFFTHEAKQIEVKFNNHQCARLNDVMRIGISKMELTVNSLAGQR